ncbi:MAG: hypothetical protein KBT18_06500, partial [Comamonas sp.]|nr:hypothetical protein [Candidatus Comamonas equi]
MAVMLNGLGKKVHASWLRGLRQGFEAMNFFANFFELIGDWIAAAVAGNWLLKRSVLPIFMASPWGLTRFQTGFSI